MATVAPDDLAGLGARLQGEVIGPRDGGYDEARAVYNAMIDKRPAAVARCASVADVIAAVGFAHEQGLAVAVRSGAHNGAGLGTVDGGLVIDLSPMSEVTVDPASRTARVQGGAQLGAVDTATHQHGLAVPAGIISTTGVGGLTLGGGVGHLSRGCGLTIDNLLGAEVVLADGSVVTVDTDRDSDLFWALRGGGGNFGIVTSFTFRCHPVATVLAGPVLYDIEDSAEVLAWYRDFILQAPEELGGFFAFLTVPPGPPFPEELHMRKVCGVVWCSTNEDPEAPALKAARSFGEPLLDGIGPVPLPAWQSAFDELYPAGDQWYWRADFVQSIPDAAIEKHVEFGKALPTWKSTMHLYPIDGAPSRVGESETAWAYRDANWAQVMVGVDPDPANAGLIRDWTIDYWEALHPHSLGGAYVNFMMDEGQERVQATYRGNYERLARTKAQYDPENFFHVNQNIRPA
jgi:FAD/FMN-containing dehydrogenase